MKGSTKDRDSDFHYSFGEGIRDSCEGFDSCILRGRGRGRGGEDIERKKESL